MHVVRVVREWCYGSGVQADLDLSQHGAESLAVQERVAKDPTEVELHGFHADFP